MSDRSPDGTLGLLLTDPTLYQNASEASARLNAILADFEANPGRYLRGAVRVL